MNNNENSEYTPSPGGSEELLQELMPKLGIEKAQASGRYKNQARVRYYLPRVLIACVVVAALVGVAAVLLLPATIQDISTTEASDRLTVDLSVGRWPLLESVTAEMDGLPVAVTRREPGSYELVLRRNGELLITASTFMGKSTSTSLTVDCVDDQPPRLDHHERLGGDIYIYLTDGEDGSGLNWDTLKATVAATGEDYPVDEVDEQAGLVRFAFPEQSVRLHVEDNNGNPLSVLLELSEPGS